MLEAAPKLIAAARLDFAMGRGRADSGDHEIVELMRAVRSPPISPRSAQTSICEHTLVHEPGRLLTGRSCVRTPQVAEMRVPTPTTLRQALADECTRRKKLFGGGGVEVSASASDRECLDLLRLLIEHCAPPPRAKDGPSLNLEERQALLTLVEATTPALIRAAETDFESKHGHAPGPHMLACTTRCKAYHHKCV